MRNKIYSDREVCEPASSRATWNAALEGPPGIFLSIKKNETYKLCKHAKNTKKTLNKNKNIKNKKNHKL